ncbi:MAG TPA: mechanosensitive ion channel domain-containing protein [Gemmatimonadales bacterium]|nr:mechanosensitive ion channel domain-containing protein [Gemmatimonadales bacterium]
MEETGPWYERIQKALEVPLVSLGETTITLWTVLYLLVLLLLVIWGSGLIRRLLVRTLERGGKIETGVAQSVGTIVRYGLVLVGLLIIVQTAGINLTTLNVIAGAVGIGVGFGLQTIAANFISGVILLVGRPIKVGDRIVVGGEGGDGIEGDVMEIGARATTVLTNDNIAVIVPNTNFVEQTVVNWSHNDHRVRFKIPVQVAYGTDVRKAEQLLLEVAKADRNVLENPAPGVRFLEFGDSGLQLELRAWSTSLIHKKGLLISNLNFAIYDSFNEHGIEIPFPQRVVHLRKEAAE